jgi:hypothetical protein
MMGLILDLVEILALTGAGLAVGSSIYMAVKSRLYDQTSHPSASVEITMPDGKSVHAEMPVKEAERLVHH